MVRITFAWWRAWLRTWGAGVAGLGQPPGRKSRIHYRDESAWTKLRAGRIPFRMMIEAWPSGYLCRVIQARRSSSISARVGSSAGNRVSASSAISGPSAKAYRLFEKIDLGPDLGRRGDGPHLEFREGGGNPFDYSLHGHAIDMLALSLLQAQLIDLQLPSSSMTGNIVEPLSPNRNLTGVGFGARLAILRDKFGALDQGLCHRCGGHSHNRLGPNSWPRQRLQYSRCD
jgi:hypothetical protein